jgi:hypothetical protein
VRFFPGIPRHFSKSKQHVPMITKLPDRFLCIAILTLGCAFPSLSAQTDGKLSVVVGDVKVTPPGAGAAAPAKQGAVVKVGSTITTGNGARAVLVTTRQSAVRIAENSSVVVEELQDSEATPKVLLDLKNGSMGALIQPQAQTAMDFKIKTPSGVAAARGTFYSVAVEDGKGFVQVKEGKVAVTPKDAVQSAAPPSGTVTKAEGDVTMTPPGGGASAPLKVGDKVVVGSTVKTGANSAAIIVITKDAAVNMTANTETLVEAVDETVPDQPKVLLDLKNGTMGALINPAAKGKIDFRIKTPSGVAAARGTFYSVAVENGRGYLNVKEGEVKVIPLDQKDPAAPDATPPSDKND